MLVAVSYPVAGPDKNCSKQTDLKETTNLI
jgi:hypothetical protein